MIQDLDFTPETFTLLQNLTLADPDPTLTVHTEPHQKVTLQTPLEWITVNFTSPNWTEPPLEEHINLRKLSLELLPVLQERTHNKGWIWRKRSGILLVDGWQKNGCRERATAHIQHPLITRAFMQAYTRLCMKLNPPPPRR